MKIINFIITLSLLVSSTSCVWVKFEGSGVFKDPIKYEHPKLPNNPDSLNEPVRAKIEIENGEKLEFGYLGNCGGGFILFGIILPIIPLPFIGFNQCEEKGFSVSNIGSYDSIRFELKYNSTIYHPDNFGLFKISNFSSFKSATDKTLIIHKKTKDGSIITKELPFDWKITTHSVVIP